MAGFEPAAPRPPAWRATKLRYIPEGHILADPGKVVKFFEKFSLPGNNFFPCPVYSDELATWGFTEGTG